MSIESVAKRRQTDQALADAKASLVWIRDEAMWIEDGLTAVGSRYSRDDAGYDTGGRAVSRALDLAEEARDRAIGMRDKAWELWRDARDAADAAHDAYLAIDELEDYGQD